MLACSSAPGPSGHPISFDVNVEPYNWADFQGFCLRKKSLCLFHLFLDNYFFLTYPQNKRNNKTCFFFRCWCAHSMTKMTKICSGSASTPPHLHIGAPASVFDGSIYAVHHGSGLSMLSMSSPVLDHVISSLDEIDRVLAPCPWQ
jgi:hypothetical protein